MAEKDAKEAVDPVVEKPPVKLVSLHCKGRAGEIKTDTVILRFPFKGQRVIASDYRTLEPRGYGRSSGEAAVMPTFGQRDTTLGSRWVDRVLTRCVDAARLMWPILRVDFAFPSFPSWPLPPSAGTISAIQAFYVGSFHQFTDPGGSEIPTCHLLSWTDYDFKVCPRNFCISVTVKFVEDGEWWMTIAGEKVADPNLPSVRFGTPTTDSERA